MGVFLCHSCTKVFTKCEHFILQNVSYNPPNPIKKEGFGRIRVPKCGEKWEIVVDNGKHELCLTILKMTLPIMGFDGPCSIMATRNQSGLIFIQF